MATTRLAPSVGFVRIRVTPWSLRTATARAPRQAPQPGWVRKAAPLVATVEEPDDHIARRAEGNFARSVIGTASL